MPLLDSILGTVGSIGQAFIGSDAARRASGVLQNAVNQGEQQTTNSYNKAQGYQQPYYDTGTQNMQTLSSMMGLGAFQTQPYNYQMAQAPQQQFQFATDPGYQFRMQQGQQAITGNAAAGGLALSGATQKALQRYGQNMASSELGNAYNRFNTNRNFNQGQYEYGTTTGMNNAMNQYNTANQQANQRFNQYSGLADMGQKAAGNMSNYATNYGQNMTDLALQRGNARASGIIGQGQAWNNAINNIQGAWMQGAGGNGQGQGQQSGNSMGWIQNMFPSYPAQSGIPNVDTNVFAANQYNA